MDIRVFWTQPAACTLSVTHALCIPLSYSSLRAAQQRSTTLLPLLTPAAFPLRWQIKGGGRQEDKIFPSPSDCPRAAVLGTEPAPPGTASAVLPLSWDCTFLSPEAAKRAGFIAGLGQVLDSCPRPHQDTQLILIHSYSVLGRQKQLPILDQALWTLIISLTNI